MFSFSIYSWTSTAGLKFTSLTKAPSWGADFYEELVIPAIAAMAVTATTVHIPHNIHAPPNVTLLNHSNLPIASYIPVNKAGFMWETWRRSP